MGQGKVRSKLGKIWSKLVEIWSKLVKGLRKVAPALLLTLAIVVAGLGIVAIHEQWIPRDCSKTKVNEIVVTTTTTAGTHPAPQPAWGARQKTKTITRECKPASATAPVYLLIFGIAIALLIPALAISEISLPGVSVKRAAQKAEEAAGTAATAAGTATSAAGTAEKAANQASTAANQILTSSLMVQNRVSSTSVGNQTLVNVQALRAPSSADPDVVERGAALTAALNGVLAVAVEPLRPYQGRVAIFVRDDGTDGLVAYDNTDVVCDLDSDFGRVARVGVRLIQVMNDPHRDLGRLDQGLGRYFDGWTLPTPARFVAVPIRRPNDAVRGIVCAITNPGTDAEGALIAPLGAAAKNALVILEAIGPPSSA